MPGITDVHIHIQPWRDVKPAVLASMRRGKEADWDRLLAIMYDPKALLEILDEAGVWRVGMVSYPSPEVMGFTDSTNEHTARYARENPERLLPYGGVHPRQTKDPAGDVDRRDDHRDRRRLLELPADEERVDVHRGGGQSGPHRSVRAPQSTTQAHAHVNTVFIGVLCGRVWFVIFLTRFRDLVCESAKRWIRWGPTSYSCSASARVPIVSAPFIMNFILLVPLAS